MNLNLFGKVFLKTKMDGLDGRTKVIFSEDTGAADAFAFVATPSGINTQGKLSKEITSMNDLQDFARLVDLTWREHLKLAPRIVSPDDGGVIN